MNAPDFTDFWHHCPKPAAGLFYGSGGGAVPTPAYLNSTSSGGSSASRFFNGGGFAAAPYHLDAAATAAAAVAAFEQRNNNNNNSQIGAHSISNSGGAIAFAPPLSASPQHHQSSNGNNNGSAQQQSQHCFAGLSQAAQFPANSFFGTGFGNFSSLTDGGGGMLAPTSSQNSNAAAATAAALLPFTSVPQTSDPAVASKKLDTDPSGLGVHSAGELRLPYNPFLKAETFFPNTNTSLSSLPATLSSASNVGITPSGYQHLFDVGGGHYASTSKGGDEKKRDDKLSANNDVKFSLMIPNSGASFKVNNNNRSHHRHNISEMTNAETRTATIPVENTTSSSSSGANGPSDYGDSKGGHNHSSNPSTSSSSNSVSSSNGQSTEQQPQITCQVCYLAASNGLHFGARTCAACAAFFRRSISDQKRYICKRSQRCVIRPGEAVGYRKMCRNCRMKRCLEIGMLPENVQNKRHRRDFYFGDTLASVPEQMPPSSSSTNSSTQQQNNAHQKSGYDQQNGHLKTTDDNRAKEEAAEPIMSNNGNGGGGSTFSSSAANTPTALLSHSLKMAAIGDELVAANGSNSNDRLNGMTSGGVGGGLSADFSNLFQIHHNNVSSSTIQPHFIPTSSSVVTNGGGQANLLDLDFQVAHLNHGFLRQNALSNGSLDRAVSTSSASVAEISDQLNSTEQRRSFHRPLVTDSGENNRSVISVLSSLPTGSHISTSLSNTGASETDASNNRIGPTQSSSTTILLKSGTHDSFSAPDSSASLSASPSIDHHYHGLKANGNNNNNSLSNNNINSLPKTSADSEMIITSPFAAVNSSSSSVITSLQQQQKLLQQHQDKERSEKMVFSSDELTPSNAAEVFFSTATGSTASSDFGSGLFVGGGIFGGHYATGGGMMSDNFFTMPRWPPPPQPQQSGAAQLPPPQQQQQTAQQHPILIDQSPWFMASQFAKNV